MRRVVRGDEMVSNRVRTIAEEESIATRRRAVVCYELQGDLYFATAEKAHRTIVDTLEDAEFVVLDFRHVAHVDSTARSRSSTGLPRRSAGPVGRLWECRSRAIRHLPSYRPSRRSSMPTRRSSGARTRCSASANDRTSCRSHASTTSMFSTASTPPRLAAIELTVEVRSFRSGQLIFRQGDEADRMFFLLRGQVSVQLALDNRRAGAAGWRRSDRGSRSARWRCSTRANGRPMSCVTPSRWLPHSRCSRCAHLDVERPEIGRTINANVARLLARRLRAANAQIRALAG